MIDDAGVETVIEELLDGWVGGLPDRAHGLRCARHAASLFEGLSGVLELKPERRRLAIAAALFHDVGYLRSFHDHHRKVFDILRDVGLPGLIASETLIVACAARYHGGPYPNIEHAGFGEMTSEDQRVVRRLAALTRVAAALDASHMGVVERVRAHAGATGASVVAFATHEAPVESDRLREAEGAFLALTRTPLITSVVTASD
ncbi:MAG TPA: HD domain-containing protein [Thermomicrobiales bacterium]|nr:HD domain-containing protein [Thermomicrobiales bacterium]